MKTIAIIYGSSMGNTQQAAETIAAKLGVEKTNVIDVASNPTEKINSSDILLLGSSTWGVGDLQDDWEGYIDTLRTLNLAGKYVGAFGTGDSQSYADSFCDAIGVLIKAAEEAGATIIGRGVPTAGYDYSDSQALEGDTFCGLPLDSDNEDDKSEERIDAWVDKIKNECGL